MAGKKGASGKASPQPSLGAEVKDRMQELKAEGDKQFSQKDFSKAAELYEQAVKILPEAAAEKADLLCNKAACLFMMKKYKEAVKECSNVLEVAATSSKAAATALRHRARSYEKQGLFKQALSDIQAINRTDNATDSTRDFEKRLKDQVAGRGRGPSLANGAAARAAATARPASGRSGNFPYYFTAKCSLGDETRLVHFSAQVTYADLQSLVAAKFPDTAHFMLKYVDRDGDLVTITSRTDVQNALAEVVQLVQAQGRNALAGGVPPIRVQVVPVASAADVPQPPMEELVARQQLLEQAKKQAQRRIQQEQEQAAAAGAAQAAPAPEEYVVDEWLVDFANLFREMAGIDPDRHVEFYNEGWDACTRAMQATLQSDKALPLFESAIDRFKEVTASGLLSWGNTHVCIAHKYLDEAAAEGKPLESVRAKAMEEFDKAEARYKEAMTYVPEFFDALAALGQLEFERAKLAAQLLVKPVRPPSAEEGGEPKAQAEAQEAASKETQEALREALTRVTKASATAAEPHFKKAQELFDRAIAAGAALDEKKKARDAEKGDGKQQAAASQQKAAGEPEINMKGQGLIMLGNMAYEWSQILAAVGAEWRPLLDAAKKHFEDAGCAAADVRNALKNHTQADQLDLGPDPEPEQPAAAPAAEPSSSAGSTSSSKPETPAAKGLPSLEVKRGKGTAAATAK